MKHVVPRRGWLAMVAAVVVVSGAGSASIPCGQAAQPSASPDDAARRPWREVVDRQAAQYQLRVGSDPLPTDRPVAILRWTNDTRITHFESGTYLWTFHGRPVAIACVFTMNAPGSPTVFAHDFQSLWTDPLVAERGGQRVWYPIGPGVEYHPLSAAPIAESSGPGRLRQIKDLAREFSATLVRWRADRNDREELRLLPQPLFRYASQDRDVLDGGLFVFVQGTDPEVVLLIEALQPPAAPAWRYALARRSSGALEAQHRGKRMWQVPWQSNTSDPTRAAISFEASADR